MAVADEIKSRLDIVDYIQRYTPLKKAGRYYKANCPFHSERTPSFVVNPDTQSWRCFGACAEGGDVFNFAMKYNGWSFTEALAELGKLVGVEVKPQTPEQQVQNDEADRLRGLLSVMADLYHKQLFEHNPAAAAVLKYAREKRGLNDDTLRKFGIGFAPTGWSHALDHLTKLGYSEDDVLNAGIATRNEETGRVYDRFRNRLMIPIKDERGRVIGFGARALDPDDNPKYLNSPETPLFNKSRVLFALDLASRSIRDTETAVIVEGYMDAIQAHQAGFSNVVAQMGTAMTEAQLKRIAPRWAKKIIMALDADAAGQSATLRGLEVARETLQSDYGGRLSVDIRILTVPGAKDPDDLIRETPERWAQLMADATPVAEYVIAVEAGNLPPNATLQEREAVARRVLPILLASESHLYRNDNLQKLALRLRIAERDLLVWAAEQQQVLAAKPPRPVQEQRPADSAAAGEGGAEAAKPGSQSAQQVLVHAAELEKFCLRMLIGDHQRYYEVNRKFRELARENQDLQRGPLADLSADDFTRSDYRALMLTFRDAIAQTDVELRDFMYANSDASLWPVLDELAQPQDSTIPVRLANRMGPDLTATIKQHGRFMASVDLNEELTEKALKLRKQRVVRQRQEIGFLQDGEAAPETEAEQAALNLQVLLYNLAEQRIDKELQRKSSLIRQF